MEDMAFDAASRMLPRLRVGGLMGGDGAVVVVGD